MKKTLLLGLILASSVQIFGAGAQDVLKQARNDYYKSLKQRPERISTQNRASSDTADVAATESAPFSSEDEYYIQQNPEAARQYMDALAKEEKANKPKTKMEKLEANAALAMEKVDFYERVVRSVQREEREVSSYNEVLGRKNSKKVNIDKKSRKNTNKSTTSKKNSRKR